MGNGVGGSIIGMFPPDYYIHMGQDNIHILFDTIDGFYFLAEAVV